LLDSSGIEVILDWVDIILVIVICKDVGEIVAATELFIVSFRYP